MCRFGPYSPSNHHLEYDYQHSNIPVQQESKSAKIIVIDYNKQIGGTNNTIDDRTEYDYVKIFCNAIKNLHEMNMKRNHK
jgi:hypothetical protein